MTRRPIVWARAMLGGGLVLLVVALAATAVQGFSDWALLLAPLAITVNGAIWMLRVNKYEVSFQPLGTPHRSSPGNADRRV